MTPKGWPISALAVELDMDRRTLAARLRDVPPCGTERGHSVWRLVDALAAVGRVAAPAVAPTPDWCRVIDRTQPHYRGLVVGALAAVYKVGGLVFSAATAMGLTEEQSDTLAAGMTIAMITHMESELARTGVEPFASEPAGQVEWVHSDYLTWTPKSMNGAPAATSSAA
jgi:hypothetical protein